MIINVTCPLCKWEWACDIWVEECCPMCRNRFYADERCSENYEDCWTELYWESNNWEY